MDNKNLLTIILILILIILAGFTYYVYSGAKECETQARACEATVTDLGYQLQTYAATLTDLQQIPECASYLLE